MLHKLTYLSLSYLTFCFYAYNFGREVNSLQEFQQIINDDSKPTIIKFYAPWCSACKAMKPVFDAGAEQYKDKALFLSIDVTKKEFSQLGDTFGIQGVPTIIYKESGFKNKEAFEKRLSAFLPKPQITKPVNKAPIKVAPKAHNKKVTQAQARPANSKAKVALSKPAQTTKTSRSS